MIELDAVWDNPRFVKINGRTIRVPFGVEMEPRLLSFLRRWIRCSGKQFAAKRMKSLKIWCLHILAGDATYKESWFTYKSYKGYIIPKLELFEYLVDNLHNLKVVEAILCVLNSHKLVIVGKPSLESITDVEPSKPSDQYIPHLRRYVKLPQVPSSCLERTEAVSTQTKYCDDFGATYSGPFGSKDEDFPAEIALVFQEMNSDPYCLGKLVPIPDKGKYRNVLVGNYALQLKTKKLADWLRQFLWKQPQITSGNQKKMSDFCIESLSRNRYMMSIDLSEATDRLSVDLQIKLLTSMGCPESFLSFLRRLPFLYDAKAFGKEGGIVRGKYANGQPMGLYISFPMFELAHFVILKFATAGYAADFRICGDDVVVACDSSKTGDIIFKRYSNLIERFGGLISKGKTMMSTKFAEGVGAIFLKGIPKEIRIPSGKLSTLEAFAPYTWLYREIVHETAVGRALLFSWLSTKLFKRYTYDQRRNMNEFMVTHDFSTWSIAALRSLDKPDHMPVEYYMDDEELYSFWRNTPVKEESHLTFVNLRKYRDALVNNKIIHLYKKERGS